MQQKTAKLHMTSAKLLPSSTGAVDVASLNLSK
jgi:hypothetical protein